MEFKRALADCDDVVLHCHQVWPADHEYVGTDIFRLDSGKVVERPAGEARRPLNWPAAAEPPERTLGECECVSRLAVA